jgi:hypothetical protein
LSNQIVDFLAVGAEIRNKPKSIQITFHKGDFYAPQVSTNCLACPKGVKYKQISVYQTKSNKKSVN